MFAGPNGSGKSSLKDVLDPHRIGFYLNSDEIQNSLLSREGLSLANFPFELTDGDLQEALAHSPYLQGADPRVMRVADRVVFLDNAVAGYYAAALSNVLRTRLLAMRAYFSFETVMSHPSKVDVLRSARGAGYRTYL